MTLTIQPDLVKAYRASEYVVFYGSRDIKFRVGETSADISELMRIANVTTASFLTASNPRSEGGAPTRWADAQAALTKDIAELGLTALPGEGRDPTGAWLAEPSLLVLGISLSDAELLAERYRQNAFLWIGSCAGKTTLNLTAPCLNAKD